MKLTKAQIAGLHSVEKWQRIFKVPFHKDRAARSVLAVRGNVLNKLLELGLIDSASPFPTSFYAVTLTDAGRAALKEMGE